MAEIAMRLILHVELYQKWGRYARFVLAKPHGVEFMKVLRARCDQFDKIEPERESEVEIDDIPILYDAVEETNYYRRLRGEKPLTESEVEGLQQIQEMQSGQGAAAPTQEEDSDNPMETPQSDSPPTEIIGPTSTTGQTVASNSLPDVLGATASQQGSTDEAPRIVTTFRVRKGDTVDISKPKDFWGFISLLQPALPVQFDRENEVLFYTLPGTSKSKPICAADNIDLLFGHEEEVEVYLGSLEVC